MFLRKFFNCSLAGALILGWLCLSVLSSCNGGDKAEAADEDKRIDTFIIQPESFRIAARSVPTIDVDGETTTYTMVSSGSLSFDLTRGGQESFELDDGDIVIERPGIATVTYIRDID